MSKNMRSDKTTTDQSPQLIASKTPDGGESFLDGVNGPSQTIGHSFSFVVGSRREDGSSDSTLDGELNLTLRILGDLDAIVFFWLIRFILHQI